MNPALPASHLSNPLFSVAFLKIKSKLLTGIVIDFNVPQPYICCILSQQMLRCLLWKLFTEVSGQLSIPISKIQAVLVE